MIDIRVEIAGLPALQASLGAQARQIPFAAAKALTLTAHDVHGAIKDSLRTDVQGGPTPYTLRAFKVAAATKRDLTAVVALRDDVPGGTGTAYADALAHLFTGGARQFKRLEGLLRARGLLPDGWMIASSHKMPLDKRGNPKRRALDEMVGILGSRIRNLGIFGRTGGGKEQKRVGFFVIPPGHPRLAPGVWRRIESADHTGTIEHWLSFIPPPTYRRRFDLGKIARPVVAARWPIHFRAALAQALATAR